MAINPPAIARTRLSLVLSLEMRVTNECTMYIVAHVEAKMIAARDIEYNAE